MRKNCPRDTNRNNNIVSTNLPSISRPMINYNRDTLINKHPFVGQLPLAPQCNGKIFNLDILVGADFYWNIANDEIVRGNGPVCISSKIGYLISGPTLMPTDQQDNNKIGTILQVICSSSSQSDDETQLAQYWNIEALGALSLDDNNDEKFNLDEYIDTKIQFLDDYQQYSAGLTWNGKKHLLPTNYESCLKQTSAMIKRLSPEQRIIFHKIITGQFRQGIIEISTSGTDEGHFLTYYGVEKDSLTTPVRLVYRCNFKYGSNPSLNDCLDSGVKLIRDLGGCHMRFRLFEIALSADIAKAFLSVLLNMEDRMYTKFLWLEHPDYPNGPLTEYQFASVLFGSTCSPFLLNAVLRKHLLKTNPRLLNDIYVDNVLTSVTSNDAQKYYETANDILAQAGFSLRSWESNDPEINKRAHSDGKNAPEMTNVNALGILWDSKSDTLKCKNIPDSTSPDAPTPRSTLSDTARVFDVTGFLLPVHVRAKRLLQDIQKDKIKWRAPISEKHSELWTEIHSELQSATRNIQWRRQAISGLLPSTPLELHVFCDSSKFCYGATAFVVANGQASIFWAKNKLIPMKDLDCPRIPRYELNSCLLGAHLSTYIRENIGTSVNLVKTVLWTDSQIVLHWINSTKKLDVYVKNRTQKIREAKIDEIRYCPTGENPADLLTRGISAKQLQNSDLWWSGPKWLISRQYPTCDLPPLTPVQVAAVDVRPTRPLTTIVEEENDTIDKQNDSLSSSIDVTNTIIEKLFDSTRFSTLDRLLRTTVYVARFVNKLLTVLYRKRRKTNKPVPYVQNEVKEYQQAKKQWIISVQKHHYSKEKLGLIKNARTGPLMRQLKLFLDEDGIIRRGSRIQNASLPDLCIYPIVLPGDKNHFTKLIIQNAHARTLHAGLNHTITRIKLSYWMPHTYIATKSLIKNCVTCNKVNSHHYQKPIPPPLPKWRVNAQLPAFYSTGCDYTGAVLVKNEDGSTRKVYICLFTCSTSRACHLEIVQNLTPEQFLMCFRRFSARRSTPKKVISDNATYFLAASTTLLDIFKHPTVKLYMMENEIQWEFITKRMPWSGGMWERLISIMKRTLTKVIGRALLSESELHTVLTEVESSMNDRPLTYSMSENNPLPITPAHLIYGRRINATPQIDFDDDDFLPITHESANKRAKYMSNIVYNFWQRYNTEYLPALRDRHQLPDSIHTEPKIKVGDVVLVHDDKHKRPVWKMAIVTKLHPTTQDGLTRSAEIKWQSGITNRPISKLYPLELSHVDADVDIVKDNNIVDDKTPAPETEIKPATERFKYHRKAAQDAVNKIHKWAGIIDGTD